MADFTLEEVAIIEASAPYQKFFKAYPEAGIEDFIAAQAKASKSFAFAQKYKKNLKPLDYFLSLKEVQRNQVLGEWTSSDAKVPVLENVVPMEAKTESVPQSQAEPQQPEPKIEPKAEYKSQLKCDRKINFETDETFLAFLENIPQMQKDFASVDSEEGLAKKQKLVDYYRFMQDGNKSREAIENQNWNFLEREYKFFPRASFKFLLETVYGNHLKKHGDTFPKRTERLQRTITYRFEDLWSGRNTICDDADLKAIEEFLSNAENGSDKEFAAKLAGPTREAIAKYKEKKQKSLDEIIAHKEEVRKRQEEDKRRKEEESAKAKEDEVITINQIPSEKPENTLKKPVIKEKIVTETTKNPIIKEEDKKEKSSSHSWQDETEKSWLDYAEKHHKKAEVTKEAEKLTVEIFANEEKAKEKKPDASITYKGQTDVSVGGLDLDLSIFENIILQSKSVSKKIRFGEIQDAEFSAKLMIACLRDKDIEMINAPKPEELQDLKPELKELLDVELEKRGLKEPSEKGREKSQETRERIYNRDNNDSDNEQRPPYKKKEYTEEETKAYLERKKKREAGNNGQRPPYKKKESSSNNTKDYYER